MKFKFNKKIKISTFFILLIIIILIIVKLSYGYDKVEMSTIYVATTGNDSTGNGTLNNPYLTLKKAVSVANSNTIIYVREGKYVFYNTVQIMNRENIHIIPYNNENVVFTTAHSINNLDYSSGSTMN